MVNVPAAFHTACKANSPQTRIRVYFIDDTVDCSDDADVIANGTLLKLNPTDTDSNGRIDITASAVTFTEYYNPNQDIEIGRTVSNTVSLCFVNDDGALSSFDFGRCKIYIDLYANGDWITVPMGVYIIDKPVKRRVAKISVTAYDQMQKLDVDASEWWTTLDFSNGLSYWDILSALCAEAGILLDANCETNLCSGTYSFTNTPFTTGVEITFREILGNLAEANACNAVFDRDGVLTLRLFDDNTTYGYTNAGGYFEFDQAEYTVQAIDAISIKSADADIGVTIGEGNTFTVTQNAFINGLPVPTVDDVPDVSEIEDAASAILSALQDAISSYTPVTFRTVGDWSLCAGDIISVGFKTDTFNVPIMQQVLSWSGGGVSATITAYGNETRPAVFNPLLRKELNTERTIHELLVDSAKLLSRISENENKYSQILQTVNNISLTVSDLNTSLTDFLSPTGEYWTFKNATNDTLGTYASHIAFEDYNGQPSIRLWVTGDDPYSVRITNSAFQIFSGENNILTFVTNEGIQGKSVTAEEKVQIGADDSDNWVWHKLSNGNLALDLI